ncbi:MAG: polysaccharide pyruvyl transferase family protein [Candidatus Woesearchaeota archaeon]
MKNIKNIIITGASLSINYGAQAMAFSTIDLVKKYYPGAKIYFSTNYPNTERIFETKLSITILERPKIKKFFINCFKLFWLSNFSRNHKSEDIYLNAYLNADLIIDISGDVLSDDYGMKAFFRNFKDFAIPLICRKRYIIFPQSIGPFKKIITRIIAKYFFNRSDFIMAREEITYKYLDELKIKPKIYLLPDTAFLLEPEFGERNKDIISRIKNFSTQGKKIIGISLSQAIIKFSKTSLSINKQIDYKIFFKNIVNTLIEKNNSVVVLIPHVVGPKYSDDDRIICKEVFDSLKNKKIKDNCIYLEKNFDSKELKAIIKYCDYFIGARMHANISAVSQNIPTISVAYSHKFYGIMDYFGLKDHVISILNINEELILKHLQELEKNRDYIIKYLTIKNKEIKKRYQDLIKILK